MKGAPWFKFYPADFMGGVVELSSEERGSYITLLCAQWSTGSLPPEQEKLERIAGGVVSESVRSKFGVSPDDGRLRNARLETHREEASAKSKAAIEANKARWGAEKARLGSDRTSERIPIGHPEYRVQSTEGRVEKTEDTGQTKELPATPQQPKQKRELVHRIESMPEGFESLLGLFNDWLEARKNTATAGAVKIALQRVQEWGKVKAMAILSDAVVGRWDGLKDYGNHGSSQSTQPGGMNSARVFNQAQHDEVNNRNAIAIGLDPYALD